MQPLQSAWPVGSLTQYLQGQRGGHQRQQPVPRVGPPWRAAEAEVMVDEFPQAQVPGESGQREQAGIGHQRQWSSKVIWIRSESLRGSIYWVLPASDRFCMSKTIVPDAKNHFLAPSARLGTHLSGGLAFSHPRRFVGGRCRSLVHR